MNRVILIKYGELTTKKGNRKFFINTLYKNINDKLKGYDVKISKDISRMYIEFMDKDLDKILKRINSIFGIHEYLVAYKVTTEISTIEESVKELLAIRTKTKFNEQLNAMVKTDAEKRMLVELAFNAGAENAESWKVDALRKLAETAKI